MPVSQQTPYNAHTGNGAAATFSFTFQVLAASDLVVALAGAVQSSGYTVSGVGAPGGGSVTFAAPPASGVKVELYRRVKLERTTDYQDNGDLLAGTVDADMDRLWMALQDVDADRDRSIKLPIGTADQTIPQNAAQRARRAVVFDDAGNVAVSASEYLTNEAALLGAVSAAAGSATAAATSASAASTSAGAAAASASAAAASATSVDTASFVKRDGTQPPTAPLTVPNGTAAGHAVNKGQLDATVSSLTLPAGIYLDAAWVVPPAGWRALRCNGQAVAIAAYSALDAAIYCGDAANGTASWGYRCTDPANPSTTRSTTGTHIVLPKTRGRYRRDLGDGTGIANGFALTDYLNDEFRSHNHAPIYLWNTWDDNNDDAAQAVGGENYTDRRSGPYAQADSSTGYSGGAETRPYTYFCTTWITY